MRHPLDDCIFDTNAWLKGFYKLLDEVEAELAEEDYQQPLVIPNGDVTIVPELTFYLGERNGQEHETAPSESRGGQQQVED